MLLSISRERFHDETATGALGTPTSGVKARISYAAIYYDLADRLIHSVNVGTNGGSSYSRPASVPSRSDTVLVNSQIYNAAGWMSQTTDAKGLINQSEYDNPGRVVKQIENYVDGTPKKLTFLSQQKRYSVKIGLNKKGWSYKHGLFPKPISGKWKK